MPSRAEKEEAAQIRIDEVNASLQVVCASDPGEVVAKLIFAFERRLRNVGVLADLNGRKDDVGLVGYAEDLVLEILKVEAELVQLRPAQSRGQVEDETVQFVVAGVATRKVGRRGHGDLIVGRRILLDAKSTGLPLIFPPPEQPTWQTRK